MTKRLRGSARPHRRPGARPSSERPATARRRPSEERPSQLEAAAVVAEDIVNDEPVEAAAELRRVERTSHPRQRTKPGSLLAARAATEYVYVAQDMRRILIVSGILFGILVVLWLLIIVLRVVPLSFY